MKKLLIILFCFLSITVNARKLYVSSSGGDDARTATQASNIATPWATWKKAGATAVAGDTVYIRDGVYYATTTSDYMNIANSGTAGNYICFFNYPGEVPVLSFTNVTNITSNWWKAVRIAYKSYLKFRGLTIRNVSAQTGSSGARISAYYNEGGDYIYYENCVAYDVDGRGFEMFDGTEIHYKNCDAYSLCDYHAPYPGNDGSGFYASTSLTDYGADMYNAKVYYEGCRAWNFADNGFCGLGVGYYEYKNCWAWNGGQLSGDGSGWKYGWGDEQNTTNPLSRLSINCIAADNAMDGWNTNNSGGSAYNTHVYNCFMYHNGYKHSVTNWESWFGTGIVLMGPANAPNEMYANNLSYANEVTAILTNGITYKHQNNSWDQSVTVTNADFLSLDTAQLRWPRTGSRETTWALPEITFGKLASSSDLIDKGVDVGLDYSGSAPDLGYAEYGEQVPAVDPTVIIITSLYPNVTYALVTSNCTDDGGGTVSARGVCWGVTTDPTTAGSHTTNGTGDGAFNSTLTPLLSNTTYHVRAYATNEAGTSYSTDQTFQTLAPTETLFVSHGGKTVTYNGKIVNNK
jgi:hypothetical protein